MPEGLGPRLAIENGFLILLAIGAAVADLDPLMIVLVMVIGWILVVLVEVLAWRARPQYAVHAEAAPVPFELPPLEEEPYGAAVPEYAAAAVVEPAPEFPPAPVEPAGAEDETGYPHSEPALAGAAAPEGADEEAGSWRTVEPEPESERAPDAVPAAAEETAVESPAVEFAKTLFHAPQSERQRVRLEPLQPRPRRGFSFRRRTVEPPPGPDGEQG